jgi:hypothetical protein
MSYHPIPWYMKQAQGGEGTEVTPRYHQRCQHDCHT